MSIVASDVFADRVARYVEHNPEATVPEILGYFLLEPNDEQRAFVEDLLANDESEPPRSDGEREAHT